MRSFLTGLVVVAAFVATGMGFKLYADKIRDTVQAEQQGVREEFAAVEQGAVEPAAGQTVESSDHAAEAASAAAPEQQGAAARIDIAEVMADRALGDANAPIRIDEYASLSCSHCAHFEQTIFPVLKEKYIETGKVYFVFNDFPLNGPALMASTIARCLPKERFFSFIDLLFSTHDQWLKGDPSRFLRQNAKLAGMSDVMFDACAGSEQIQQGLGQRMQEARGKYHIESTPTFVLNGGAKIISGAVSIEQFEAAFEEIGHKVE